MGPEGYKPVHFSVAWFRRIPSLPQLSPLTSSPPTLSLPSSSLRQERSTRSSPSRQRQTLFTPISATHTITTLHQHLPPTLTSSLPITMSIRRNNVRVSFLLSDSESSLELYVPDDLFRSTTDANQLRTSSGRNRDHLPHSASRRSILRGGSSARGRRSLGPPGRLLGTLSSLRVSS